MEPEIKIKKHFALKFVLIALGMLLVAGVLVVGIIRDRIVNPPLNQVSIVGQGKISYQPDIANVTLGVQIDKAAKAEDALKNMDDKITKIIAALKADGLEEADIKTQNYSLNPQYDYTNGVATSSGYTANEQLVAKIKDINNNNEKIGKVIADASAAGANQIAGVAFEASNIENLKQQARVAAISDAKDKAIVLANAAGVKLGEIIGWWENIVQVPFDNSAAYSINTKDVGGGASAPTVTNGNQDIIIEMSLNYRVK
jgi:hypothetical protein